MEAGPLSTACSRQASAERWCFCRCGCTEKVCSQRCTVVLEIPVAAASERALQWVLPSVGYSFGEGFA
jgi:hypothetical protein